MSDSYNYHEGGQERPEQTSMIITTIVRHPMRKEEPILLTIHRNQIDLKRKKEASV